MAKLAEEYEQHRDEVEEVEDNADPDGSPGKVILDDLVLNEGRLDEKNVADASESCLI